ncbi:MAG: TIR domain-containing protein [Oscillospiraceae bacterium]|nr:TIR domain-containing protein [Oscillospiraceae bacterium]
MAILKCKMCGGDLVVAEGLSVAQCEYCGTTQTVPGTDNEKKVTLFARAGRLRADCEFDKASGIYEAIVADFPREAEAYWGLVLCKYGIEYVDDPATGKKIPTSHRPSFDSVPDDPNFTQALENADAVAARVYRAEGEAIEEIRKGIIEVSGREAPYDIFICYKEADDRGERTLDSVLAQDIYDALTEKNYRVFFSRISLEDKLGLEYEPYIFAALNSAKIMLVVGTTYDHFNAVWVRNEWSRYLKLMAADKTRHLIPCYKGVDAYDMPKEFARLQALDLGKLGAMQDLLRGIEKLMPGGKPAPQIREQTVRNDDQITSLLNRGNLLLEEGNWEVADRLYDAVLHLEPTNARSYIGKALIQEKCRTMEALIQKHKQSHRVAQVENLHLQPDQAHIQRAAETYQVPGYLNEVYIRSLYQFDLAYPSVVGERRAQYLREKAYWEKHRYLTRAERFAAPAEARLLADAREKILTHLEEQLQKAEEAEDAAREKLLARYADFLTKTDETCARLHGERIRTREQHYETWRQSAAAETDPERLKELAESFDRLGDYRESRELAAQCRSRIADRITQSQRMEAEARLQWEQVQAWNTAEQLRCQQANRKLLGRMWIPEAVLFVAGIITLVLSIGLGESVAEKIGNLIAAILIQTTVCGATLLTAALALAGKEKQGKICTVLSWIFAVIGALFWSLGALVERTAEFSDKMLSYWCLLVVLIHLTAFVTLFFRKKPRKI